MKTTLLIIVIISIAIFEIISAFWIDNLEKRVIKNSNNKRHIPPFTGRIIK